MSIRQKLLLSMASSMVIFLIISSALGFYMTKTSVRERTINVELPAVVGEIRNEILRKIAIPLTNAQSIANNSYLLDWERQGYGDAGVEAWKKYATSLKEATGAASVFWVSADSGKYFTEAGYLHDISRDSPNDQWFYQGFMANNRPYTLEIDKNSNADSYIMFINVRFDAGGGKSGAAGLGLSIDSLANAVRTFKVGESGSVYLVRSNGMILIHQDSTLVDGKHNFSDLPGMNKEIGEKILSKEKLSIVEYKSGEGDKIIASSYLPEIDAYVIVQVPENEVFGWVRNTAKITVLATSVIGGGIGLIVIFLVSHAIAAPVRRAAKMLSDIADGNGDLTRRMPVETGDEIGALASAFNRFAASLERMVSEVRLAADSISTASTEVAQGNYDLSHRTEQTASALQQAALSLSELTASVQSNAQSTKNAGQLAQVAKDVAERGGAAVGQVVATMNGINEASEKIADIIGVIDGIAFQTNILALNAAVEAARAGDQGRGFAVVAAEVRALAGRSSAAAKEIRSLITNSVDQVSNGSIQVAQAGVTMQELRESVLRVSTIIDEIRLASNQQDSEISNINASIGDLDMATQQNSALVEESAAAASSLKEQAGRLLKEVGEFKINNQKILTA